MITSLGSGLCLSLAALNRTLHFPPSSSDGSGCISPLFVSGSSVSSAGAVSDETEASALVELEDTSSLGCSEASGPLLPSADETALDSVSTGPSSDIRGMLSDLVACLRFEDGFGASGGGYGIELRTYGRMRR